MVCEAIINVKVSPGSEHNQKKSEFSCTILPTSGKCYTFAVRKDNGQRRGATRERSAKGTAVHKSGRT